MRFQLVTLDLAAQMERVFALETDGFRIFDAGGEVRPTLPDALLPKKRSQPVTFQKKPGGIQTVRLQLGLRCNYNCAYCHQSTAREHDSACHPRHKEATVAEQILAVADPTRLRVEFWGGEPLLYWPTIQAVADRLLASHANVSFGLITNGSLLTDEKAEWLIARPFSIGISHDGPGQAARGADPFDTVAGPAIRRLYAALSTSRRISFNPMVTGEYSRRAIRDWFQQTLGVADVSLGEGGVLDLSLSSQDALRYRQGAPEWRLETLLDALLQGTATSPWYLDRAHFALAQALVQQRTLAEIPLRCPEMADNGLAMSTDGVLLRCHNESAADARYGHVTDLAGAALRSQVHTLADRPGCLACPVVHSCRGGCPVMGEAQFARNCSVQYGQGLVVLALLLLQVSNCLLLELSGPGGTEPVFDLGDPAAFLDELQQLLA